MQVDWVIRNVRLATMQRGSATPYGAVEDGVLAVTGEKLAWVGARGQAPHFDAEEEIDGGGGWLTPGLIDCHTHLVYAGNRAREFEMRLQGVSYAEIARQGGGINSTVAATRAASEEALLEAATRRVSHLLCEGVTTIEIKSGYGLDLDTELRLLRVARALEQHFPLTICTTFLGAHAVPNEYRGRDDDYIQFVCEEVLPAVAAQRLADAVDVFCEGIGFDLTQTRRVFEAARRLGLPIKGHVEQLSYSAGARLVAEYGGLSVDHVEYLPESDIPSLAQAQTVAVLLPGAFYFLNETRKPPVAALRAAGVAMAVATDLNPGSSPLASLLTAMNQACVLFGLTPEEALAGATCHAAQALALGDQRGQLVAGFAADVVLWPIEHPAELSYAINMNSPQAVWAGGKRV